MNLPEWLSLEAWAGFLEMRVKIKKPMTKRAKELAIGKLDAFRRNGYDPNAILDESTFHDWQGLYPPKEPQDGDGASRKTFDAIRRDNSVTAIRRTVESYNQVGGDVHGIKPQGNKRIGDGGIH